VKYELHPEAALEHEEQISYYEARSAGLGARYHVAFRQAALKACATPRRYRVVDGDSLRRVSFRGFPHHILYREIEGSVQILAVAHDRRRPGYWTGRL
jgi:plasmid stabilization system protein ParE